MQRFRLIERDGREVELEAEDAPVFPYGAMKKLARENKFVNYRIERVE